MPRKTPKEQTRGRKSGAPHQPKMTSAPHQSASSDKGEVCRIYVVYRPAADQEAGQGGRRSWWNRRQADLPPELFPGQHGGGSWQWLRYTLITAGFFIAAYAAVNGGAYVIEQNWVTRNGVLHRTFCTGVDIAISAGIGFEAQFDRAQCPEAWGGTPTPQTPPPDAKS